MIFLRRNTRWCLQHSLYTCISFHSCFLLPTQMSAGTLPTEWIRRHGVSQDARHLYNINLQSCIITDPSLWLAWGRNIQERLFVWHLLSLSLETRCRFSGELKFPGELWNTTQWQWQQKVGQFGQVGPPMLEIFFVRKVILKKITPFVTCQMGHKKQGNPVLLLVFVQTGDLAPKAKVLRCRHQCTTYI